MSNILQFSINVSGIYIHIPFCRQACTYCDFHFSTSLQYAEPLISALQKEIVLRKDYLRDEKIETIYFGGGTPSLIDTAFIKSILKIIHDEFVVMAGAEITLEANPDDLTIEKSEDLIRSGINRLSIGIQSFFDDDLRFMNRAHDARQAISAIENVKKAGFENISIDLIYGIQRPGESHWKENLERALSLEVDHLSCYALTIEPRTVLADMIRKKKVPPPDDEKTVADFELLMDRAAKAGYDHYEISNFARKQKYSRHNTSYWQRKKYLGIGPSAHSYDGVSRQWNVANNQEYIRRMNENIIPFEKEELTAENKFNEYILTSLRTMWGIDVSLIEGEFGSDKKSFLINRLNDYLKKGMIIQSGENFILTREGKFFADRIAAEMFV